VSGPQSIAAFFDLDGTLLAPPSLEWRFISYLLWSDELGAANILRWLSQAARSLARGPRQAVLANKQYVAGLAESLVADWADSLEKADSCLSRLQLFEQGLDRIEWHQSQNHLVFLVSGTLAPLATSVASRIGGKVGAIATELATSTGMRPGPDGCAAAARSGEPEAFRRKPHPPVWTGQLASEHMAGAAKCRALRSLAARHDLDLTKCYAYGDSWSDRAMLEAVGHPEAVNPSRLLAQFARKQGWPVSQWVPGDRCAGRDSRLRPLEPARGEQSRS
jgi:HAD superfamily phosphoserine phosphatase-like hydrolase